MRLLPIITLFTAATSLPESCHTFYENIAANAFLSLGSIKVDCSPSATRATFSLINIEKKLFCSFKNYTQASFVFFHEFCHLAFNIEDQNGADQCALELLKKAFSLEVQHLKLAKLDSKNFFSFLSRAAAVNNALQRLLISTQIYVCL